MKQNCVAIVLPSLVGGGAERVAIDLANHWSRQSRSVTLVTIDRCQDSRYPILDGVHRIGLNMMVLSRSRWSAIRNNVARVAKLRKVIRGTGATTIVSFTDVTNVTTLLACCGTGLRTIVCERTDPRHHAIGRSWQWLRERLYGRASAMVVQTESVRKWAERSGWPCPTFVIPNAAPEWLPSKPRGLRDKLNSPTILGLGRLSEEKGFHTLIEAFARIAGQFPAWHLTIFGEGPERSRLERLIEDRGLTARVHLPGWTTDAAAVLSQADLFVLPSRYEGFPNALLEAMAAGLPCISFDCDSGPREIIRHAMDGMLVPPGNRDELARTLAQLMEDRNLRDRLGTEARQVRERFSPAEFYRRWDAVLDDLLISQLPAPAAGG